MLFLCRRSIFPLAIAFVLLGSAACGNDAEGDAGSGLRATYVDSSNTRAHRLMSLVERADTLSTLARALEQAGLAEDLRMQGPYTLFAPTNRAFEEYWLGFDSLLAPAGTSAVARRDGRTPRQTPAPDNTNSTRPDRDSLRQVLQFHLVQGRFTADDIADSLRLGTLINESLLLERAPRNRLRVRVKGTPGPVPVVRTLEAQNGVLHLLARPLRIPPPDTSAQGALRPSDTTDTPTPTGGN